MICRKNGKPTRKRTPSITAAKGRNRVSGRAAGHGCAFFFAQRNLYHRGHGGAQSRVFKPMKLLCLRYIVGGKFLCEARLSLKEHAGKGGPSFKASVSVSL